MLLRLVDLCRTPLGAGALLTTVAISSVTADLSAQPSVENAPSSPSTPPAAPASIPSSSATAAAAPPTASAAPEEAAASATAPQDETVVRLARVLERRITVWRRPDGSILHAAHCRTARGGCRARLALFARWFVEIAEAHDVDPYLLAAMAVRESGLDPFAQGGAGELGIVQLHPLGVGRSVRFVRNETYRARCTRDPGACQREVIEAGADHVASAISYCGGLEEGLGLYNRGECGETDYSRRVMRERELLLSLARTVG